MKINNNFTVSPDFKLTEICLPEAEFKQTIINSCKEVVYTKPLIFIGVALIMDIIEPFLYARLLSDKIVWEYKNLNIKVNDFLFLYRIAKKIFIILAITFMILQFNAIN